MGIGCYGPRPGSLKQLRTDGRISSIGPDIYQYTCQDSYTFMEAAKIELKMMIDKVGSSAIKRVQFNSISLDNFNADQHLNHLLQIYDLFSFARPSFYINFSNCHQSASLLGLAKVIEKFRNDLEFIGLNFEPFEEEETNLTEEAISTLVKTLAKHKELKKIAITLKLIEAPSKMIQKLLMIPLEIESVKGIKFRIIDCVNVGTSEMLLFVKNLEESKKELTNFCLEYTLSNNMKIEESQAHANMSSVWITQLFDHLHTMTSLKKLGFACQSCLFLDSKAFASIFNSKTKATSIDEFRFECKGVSHLIWDGEVGLITKFLETLNQIAHLQLGFVDQPSFDNAVLSALVSKLDTLTNLKSLDLDLKNTNISEKGLAGLACLKSLPKLQVLKLDLQLCFGKFLSTLSDINIGLFALKEYQVSTSKADNLMKFCESLKFLKGLTMLKLNLQNFVLSMECAKELGHTLMELNALIKVEIYLVDVVIEKKNNNNAILDLAREVKLHPSLDVFNFNLTRCNINPTDHPIEELEKILSTAKNLQSFGWSLNA